MRAVEDMREIEMLGGDKNDTNGYENDRDGFSNPKPKQTMRFASHGKNDKKKKKKHTLLKN